MKEGMNFFNYNLYLLNLILLIKFKNPDYQGF